MSISKMEAGGIKCKGCSGEMDKMISIPAHTPGMWNGGWNEGLSGSSTYDIGLGMNISNEAQRQRELDKRGWIRESDLGPDWWDKQKAGIKEENAKIDAKAKEYKENIKKYDGDKEKAVSETWKASDCLAGAYDD